MSIRKTLKVATFCFAATATSIVAVAQEKGMPTTTKQIVRGATQVTNETLNGTVEYVEGNDLLVRMSTGELRHFNVPESRRFVIDGKDLTVHDLKVGTKLSATITTTTTPVTERTTTVGSGKVWWVNGRNVVLTLPNGENHSYKVEDSYRFNIEGNKQATVADLRKGMTVSAQRIVEEPRVEITSNTTVTGTAPPAAAPKQVVAQTTKAPATPVAAPAPAPAPRAEVAQARPTPAPAPAAAAAPAQTTAPAARPTTLPTTGSQLPLVALLGVLMIGAGVGLRRFSHKL